MKHLLLSLTALVIGSALWAQAPYASYPLDGNANDVSGNNLHGSITGTPAASANRYNQSGKALIFNGSSDFVDLPESFDLPTKSVVVWFNVSNVPASGNGNVIYSSDNNSLQYGNLLIHVFNFNGSTTLRLQAGQAIYNASANVNTWYQAAMVRTPTAVKFYVNGALVYTGVPDNTHSANGAANATVGCDRIYGGKTKGRIDDLEIYNTALTNADITGNYTSISEKHLLEENTVVSALGGVIRVKISPEVLEQISEVQLQNMNGQLLRQVRPVSETVEWSDPSLAAGMYFVSFRTKTEGVLVSKKVVLR